MAAGLMKRCFRGTAVFLSFLLREYRRCPRSGPLTQPSPKGKRQPVASQREAG